MIEQLQSERESRVSELKSELGALSKLMEVEHRRMANVLPLANSAPAPQLTPPSQLSQAPQLSLSDFIMHGLNEAGAMSKDDIVNLTLNEGYFADAESADRGVQASLVTLHRNEHIRQMHDGTFAPATLTQTIRFRRAI
ncbi:MAG TPA: hypothetical protein VGY14_04210 [Methyloceanibacter sp.]|jgi:hypothetical protein|nr:hypothetical protein [Methyloceanibacter sp.]